MAFNPLWDTLEPFLVAVDTLGSVGSLPFPRRSNLLVSVTQRDFSEDQIALHIQRVVPEGFGIDQFFFDHLNIPKDEQLPESELLLWNAQRSPPPQNTLLWIIGATDSDYFRGQLEHVFVADQFTKIIPCHVHQTVPDRVKLLELYAGGFGGWKSALNLLTQKGVSAQVVAIESDREASISYALTHHANWVGPHAHIPDDLFTHSDEHWILQKDVHDPALKTAIGKWGPNMISISAPCPPWSSAAYSEGLNGHQGQLFLQTILECRWYRAPFVLMEQVANFPVHPHGHYIRKGLHFIGYRLVWQRTLNLLDHCKTARNRWVALAVRIHADTPVQSIHSWPTARPDIKHPVDLPLTTSQKQRLHPTPEALATGSDPKMYKAGRQASPMLRSLRLGLFLKMALSPQSWQCMDPNICWMPLCCATMVFWGFSSKMMTCLANADTSTRLNVPCCMEHCPDVFMMAISR